MSDQPKYQWTGVWTTVRNGISINENITLRMDDREEIFDLRKTILDKIAPSSVSFPNDEGTVAQTRTQEQAPLCSVHGTPMTLKPAGVSKAGKAYPAFWACATRNADGSFCKSKPKE